MILGVFWTQTCQSDGPIPDPRRIRPLLFNLLPSPPPVTIKEQMQLTVALIYSNKAFFLTSML